MFGGKSKNMTFDQKKFKRPRKRPEGSDAHSETATVEDTSGETLDLKEPLPTPKVSVKKAKRDKPHKAKEPRTKLPLHRDKRTIGIIMIVASLILTLCINPAISYLNRQQTTTAVVASTDIAIGTAITREMLSEVKLSTEALMPSQFLSVDEVVGKYAGSKMLAGEIVSKPKLASTMPLSDAYLYALPEGKKAISVSVTTLSSSISGKLASGDIVSVYVPTQTDSKDIRNQSELPPELVYVEVLSSTNVDGLDITDVPKDSTLESPLPATITLAADDAQAAVLAAAEIRGGVHLALVSRGDELQAEQLLSAQSAYNLSVEVKTDGQ